MSRYIVLLLLVFLFLFNGCMRRGDTSASSLVLDVKLDLDLERDIKSIHDINLIRDVEIVNLDCDEAVIGELDKVILFDSILYLMDNSRNNSIYLFSLDGKYISTISDFGSGPEEYIQLTDIFIDTEDSTLNVLSRVDSKLLKYDLVGERLVSVMKTPKSFTSMQKTSFGYIGYMANWTQDPNAPYNLWMMNNELEIIDCYFEIDEMSRDRSYGDGYPFSAFSGALYYITPCDYYIYSFNKNKVDKNYRFDLGKYEIPVSMIPDLFDDNKRFEVVNKYIHRFYHFQETKNHLMVHFLFRGQDVVWVYDKEKKSGEAVELTPYEGKYFIPFGKIVGFEEEYIFTTIEAWNLKRIWGGDDGYNNFEDQYPVQIKNLRKKIKSIREDGNPILVLYFIE